MSLLSSTINFFNGSYSFEVQGFCKELDVDLDTGCQIHFNNSTDTVISYGTAPRED